MNYGLLLIALGIFCGGCTPKEEKGPEAFVKTSKITREFVKEQISSKMMECRSSKTDVGENVNYVKVSFNITRNMSLTKARALIVELAQDLMKRLNESEEVRPYLCEHPIGINMVQINITFDVVCDDLNSAFLMAISMKEGKIFYKFSGIDRTLAKLSNEAFVDLPIGCQDPLPTLKKLKSNSRISISKDGEGGIYYETYEEAAEEVRLHPLIDFS